MVRANPIDRGAYGYGKLTRFKAGSILMSYVQRHAAPQRCMMVRFKVNATRDGVELLPIDGSKK